MSLIVSSNATGGFAPMEAGTYPAICYGLVDLGEQYSETYDKWSPKILILFEIPGETLEINGEEVSRTMSKSYTMSLNEKAALRKDLASWRGRDFTPEELKGFDLRNILGAPCMVSVIHRERGGKTYADINGIMKLPKSIPVDPPRCKKIVFDLDKSPLSDMEKLPEWIQERIRGSQTYAQRIGLVREATEQTDDIDDEEVPF